jgi:serine/threonine-protein kinase
VSLWKKIFGVEDEEAELPEPPEPPVSAGDAGEERALTAEEQLAALGDSPAARIDANELGRLFEELRSSGREARAIDLLRRVLTHERGFPQMRLRLAEVLSARGDDDGARRLLESIASTADAPLSALMLMGEIAERRGDDVEALAFYERVLARDLDYPRARERAVRMREERQPRRELAGATLVTDGALARGRYRVQRELGRGGAGTVFLARDGQLGRHCALKVYHRRGRVERERLRIEARTPAQLEHPGIVRIFDLDETLGSIAMEWVRGGSVRREMNRGAVPVERVKRWLATALDALEFTHFAGWVHRDLKPSNFLLRDDDRVVLTDFGLALRVGEVAPERGYGGEGTLAYMAPEQRAGAVAHPAADVHAFGATMREVLGRASGASDPHLVEVAAACMRRDPAERPSVRWLRGRLAPADPT